MEKCESCYHQHTEDEVDLCGVPAPKHLPWQQWDKWKAEQIKNNDGICECYLSRKAIDEEWFYGERGDYT